MMRIGRTIPKPSLLKTGPKMRAEKTLGVEAMKALSTPKRPRFGEMANG